MSDFDKLLSNFDNLFGKSPFFSGPPRTMRAETRGDHVVVSIEVPGYGPGDLDVNLDGTLLSVRTRDGKICEEGRLSNTCTAESAICVNGLLKVTLKPTRQDATRVEVKGG